ncbi:MAG: hypothetical protein J1E96_05600 [Ruminococcus sp.]|nr:hypothetical protein [Ruminococcus sp.]
MNDMIKKLVDIDEKAKSYSEETKRETARIEAEIKAECEKIYSDKIDEAMAEVENESKKLSDSAEQAFLQNENKRKAEIEKLEADFEKNSESWVNTIVNNVLS